MTDETYPVLKAEGISKFFPGTIALDDVELTLFGGEIHAILGENGAGKSTKASQELGIGTVYQEVNLLPNLTVAENLYLGRQPMRAPFVARRKMNEAAYESLKDFGIDIDPTQPLSTFSVAVQQVVAIARAVEMSGKVLILDEPTASLDRDEVQLLFSVIRKLKERGLTIVFITHFLDQVFENADRATVLRNGQVVGTRLLKDVNQKDIVTLMLGRQLEAQIKVPKKTSTGEVLLSIEGLGKTGMLDPFSLDIREGEVVGLAGLLG